MKGKNNLRFRSFKLKKNSQDLALTDKESDNATAPRKPDHMRIIASFQSKP